MSYLLDALNKSKGDGSASHSTSQPAANYSGNEVPQPVMYPSYAPEPQTNIYKWVSIVLALVLTLIVGIVLGNKYALLGVPEPKTTPMQTAQLQTAQLQTAQQASSAMPAQNQQATTSAQPASTNTASNIANSEVAQVAQAAQQTPEQAPQAKEQATEQVTAQATEQEDNEQLAATEQEPQGEPQVVGYQPDTITTDGKRKEAEIDDISNDLLSKFNQAIKETEGTEDSYQQDNLAEQANLQADQEIDGYLTRVPHIRELKEEQKKQVPAMVYETHLYSTDRFQRWVKINGRSMQETQWITEDIQIHEIQKQFLILEMGHIRFSLPALTDWTGPNK